jgi:hypothetical protein
MATAGVHLHTMKQHILQSGIRFMKTSSSAGRDIGGREPEVATTRWGSSVFRTLNFELYAKPQGWNKVMAYVGSAAFVGVMGYITFMGLENNAPPAAKVSRS